MNSSKNNRESAPPILELRGLFWWHEEVLPEDVLAPDSCVGGLLRIENSGRGVLELDSYLPNPHGPFAGVAREPVAACIQGILTDSNERVLLCDVFRAGGRFSSNGISFERFSAEHCLFASTSWRHGKKAPLCTTQTIPLAGFEEWLRLGAIKVEHAPSSIAATYKAPHDVEYRSDDGALSLIFDVEDDMSGMFGTHALSLKQTAYAKLTLKSPATLTTHADQFRLFEDLLKLLTGHEYELGWPVLTLPDGSTCRWYFLRMKNRDEVEAPSHYNTITVFPELREGFGMLWTQWKAMREAFGPGVYLYFGARRGMPMYVEHRFVNFAWGLEALHRKRGRGGSVAVAAKVQRILDKIENRRDNRWLAKKLEHAEEPSLEQRLFDTFSVLPLGMDEEKLRCFCRACAKLRNDISHFGGERHGKTYTAFLEDVNEKCEALSTLYHAVLLHECGIEAGILKRWIFDSFLSFPIKTHFVKAGLLDPDVLRPPEPPAPDIPTPRGDGAGR